MAWANDAQGPSGVFGFLAQHYWIALLLWLAVIGASIAVAFLLKDSLFETNFGARLSFSLLTVVNCVFLIVPGYLMETTVWWYNIISGLMMFAIVGFSFPVLGNFLFMSYSEETGRKSSGWFSETVYSTEYSGAAAVSKGFERWIGIEGVTVLLFFLTFIANLFVQHYAPMESNTIARLQDETLALLERGEIAPFDGFYVVTKDEEKYKIQRAEVANYPSTQDLVWESLSEKERRSSNTPKFVYFKTENYGVFVPPQNIKMMKNSNAKHEINKRLQFDIFDTTYALKEETINIRGYSDELLPQSIRGITPPEDGSAEISVEINNIVILKNFMENRPIYDPMDAPIKTPLYETEIVFENGETILFSSPHIGGTYQWGDQRGFRLVIDDAFEEVPFDEIARIEFNKSEIDEMRSVIVTTTDGENIRGGINVSNSDPKFTGISTPGWIIVDLAKVVVVDFTRSE